MNGVPCGTGLLVSVRSLAEAQAALLGGAHVIDVKEPHAGSLGRAAAETLREIAQAVSWQRPLSVALGELRDADPLPGALPENIRFAKWGLAGMARHADWAARWQAAVASLPAQVAPVAVVYADGAEVESPEASAIVAVSRTLGCPAVLVDTYQKDGRGLCDHWSKSRIAAFINECRQAGQRVALAGGLTCETLGHLSDLAADLFAVRGAACQGGRTEQIVVENVSRLRRLCTAPPTLDWLAARSAGANRPAAARA